MADTTSFDYLLDQLRELGSAAGEKPCGAREMVNLAESVADMLDLHCGPGNMHTAELAILVQESVGLMHEGTVHGSLLVGMATLMERARGDCAAGSPFGTPGH